jgi:hypothetical protein
MMLVVLHTLLAESTTYELLGTGYLDCTVLRQHCSVQVLISQVPRGVHHSGI